MRTAQQPTPSISRPSRRIQHIQRIQHIEDYALIGDLRTAALVGADGSIDWLPLPRFDSPALFTALLGSDAHGHWTLAPDGKQHCTRRRYRPGTMILETDWTTAQGAVRVTDFMDPTSPHRRVIRVVDGLAGQVSMHTIVGARMGYGRTHPRTRKVGARWVAVAAPDALWLDADVDLDQRDATLTGRFTVAAGQRITFTLTHATAAATSDAAHALPDPDPAGQLAATEAYWTEWTSRGTYIGRWAPEVAQSLVVLKALTYAPTGAIVAATSTSLPEQPGGSRNWDYRFSWLRDATFTVQAFLDTGHLEEATAWRDWLIRTVAEQPQQVQIMYGIDGTRHLPEQILDWLPGHAGSAPVRVGNAAAGQQQNDVWGEVLDILHAIQEAGAPPAPGEEELRDVLLAHLLANWTEPDHGLWEVRGPRRHFVHSKVMAWVGVDRTLRALEQAPDGAGTRSRLRDLRTMRAAIRAEILDRGFQPRRRTFTQSYGSRRLDAAALLTSRYGFLPWTNPLVVDTVETLSRDLTRDGLVLRYATHDTGANVDGVPGTEGVFLAASFWLADALHQIGRTDEATALFERLLALRNDVGLLSEEYDPATGHHLGNTPQAFSHAGLVTTALQLSAQPTGLTAGAAAAEENTAC